MCRHNPVKRTCDARVIRKRVQLAQNEPNPTEKGLDLEYVLKELDNLRDGVSLLGLKQCGCCRKYFHCQHGEKLVNIGQLVCYSCLGSWWQQRSPHLSIKERSKAEHEILRWLLTYHEAKVVRDKKHMPDANAIELKIAVECGQCVGKGTLDLHPCQSCDGRGSNWVIVLKPHMR